jgi:hypothetical protein
MHNLKISAWSRSMVVDSQKYGWPIRDIVGFGTGWWWNVNGRVYRFDRVMKYMIDRDKLIG